MQFNDCWARSGAYFVATAIEGDNGNAFHMVLILSELRHKKNQNVELPPVLCPGTRNPKPTWLE
jgi:hypothetical protein